MSTLQVRTIKVHEHLRSKLCELYESDCIFDKFECRCANALLCRAHVGFLQCVGGWGGVGERGGRGLRALLGASIAMEAVLRGVAADCGCRWGHDSNHVCTGTYDNKLLMWDVHGDGHTSLESVSSSPSRRSSLKGKLGLTRKESTSGRNFNKKILHHSHHPFRNLVAIGARPMPEAACLRPPLREGALLSSARTGARNSLYIFAAGT